MARFHLPYLTGGWLYRDENITYRWNAAVVNTEQKGGTSLLDKIYI